MSEFLDGNDLPTHLHTSRLQLRPYKHTDVDDVFGYAADPRWAQFLPLPTPYTFRHAEEFVATAILYDRATHVVWAVEHDGHVIGGLNVRVTPSDFQVEIGYAIAREQWGKGLVTEAARVVLDTCFEHMPALVRVEALADSRNTASSRVMQKLGMTHEGTLRKARFIRGQHVDFDIYSVLRAEWNGVDVKQ